VIVSHVYEAGEAPIEGASRDALIEGLRRHGVKKVAPLDAPEDLPKLVREMARPGDMVVCLGAGTITQWANDLPQALVQLEGKAANG